MGNYIGIRLAHALVILAIVVLLVFVIARLIPYEIHTSDRSFQPRSIALRDCSPCIMTMGPGLP